MPLPVRSFSPLLVSLLLWPALALAQLTPEKVAQIRLEEQEAMEKISKEHGDRLPGEMDNAERRQVIEKQRAASAAVLQKHGVSTKDFALYTMRMSREEQEQSKTAQRRLEDAAKAKKEKERAAKKDEKKGEKKDAPSEEDVVIQQGFGEENPVELEASEDAPPEIQRGTPAE